MKPITVLSLLLLISSMVSAEPIVIYDSGHTQPMVHPPSNLQLKATPGKNHQVNFPRVPVVTPSISPGKVFSRSIHHPYLSNPIFIVGYDMISLRWLQEHKEKLKQNHAIGIVVNVQTEQQVNQLQQVAGGIQITPVSGTKVAKQLSLAHYPVLISSTLIEQ